MKRKKVERTEEEREAMQRNTEVMYRFESHEKRFGDTAKMRERLGLEPGVVPPSAWKDGEGGTRSPGKAGKAFGRSTK